MRRTPGVLLIAAVMLTLIGGVRAQTSGTFLSFQSDPGDFIGQGQSRFFTPDTASFQSRVDSNNGHINVALFPFDGGFWFLDLAAPQGQQLVPGVYEGATRWPFQAPGVPGISFTGDGRGCNTATGRFQVFTAVYGPNGYVVQFHATFEQHCEGAAPALRGEVRIENPPPPPPLEIMITVNAQGNADRITGVATVSGTLRCSVATTVNLFAVLRQRANRFSLASGSAGLVMPCSPTAAAWSLQFSPGSTVPFNAGHAQLDATANAFDPNFGTFVSTQITSVVRLNRSGP